MTWQDKFVKRIELRNLQEDKDRKVTWTELFYDLVFVVVISELSHNLFRHTSIIGILQFIFLFIAMCMAGWQIHFIAIALLDVLCIDFICYTNGIFVVWQHRSNIFILLYIAFRAIIMVQYLNVYIK